MKLYIAIALAFFATASAGFAEKSKGLNESYTLEQGQALRIDFPIGDLRIEAGKGQEVEVDLQVTCRWSTSNCDKALEEIHVASRSSDRRLALEIDGYPKWQMKWIETEGTIKVPANASLDVDMGVGDLEIEGLHGNQRIELGVGEVKLWADMVIVGSIALEAGVGDTDLHGVEGRVQEQRSNFVGSEIYWNDGPGESNINIDVGVGEASVWLE